MYFVNFLKDTVERIGVLTEDKQRVICLGCAEKEFFGSSAIPATMREIIEQQDRVLPLIKRVIEKAAAASSSNVILNLRGLTIKAPYKNPPRNILCVGHNYESHVKEGKQPRDMPKFPVLFSKPWTAIADPDSAIDGHVAETDCFDYEIELAVIIGKGGKNISKEKASDHIFGYSIINDMSARDLQKRTPQWYSGKCLDESAPFGPYLVHKSAIDNPQNLNLRCTVNGEIRQDSNTRLMIFDIPTIIAAVSHGSTMQAGDIIATGTCSGVGSSFTPQKFLKKGDAVVLEIENIGILRNSIR